MSSIISSRSSRSIVGIKESGVVKLGLSSRYLKRSILAFGVVELSLKKASSAMAAAASEYSSIFVNSE